MPRKTKQPDKARAISRVLALVVFGCVGITALSSISPPPEKKLIILEHADSLTYDRAINPDAQRLIGNVRFRHENTVMTSDSAYLFSETNSFQAFGNIYMNQGDSIELWANSLYYDGKTRLAELRDNVTLTKSETTLYTDILDYDRGSGIAEYFDGGTIVDSLNTLTSSYGRYNTKIEKASFQDSVRLENPDIVMTTEDLDYNTRSKVASWLGSTLIESDSGHIVSTRGVYDTEKDLSILLDRSTVYSDDKIFDGDSILYDRKLKFGEAFGNMILTDTTNKSQLYGQYGYFDEVQDYAFATERSYLKEYSKPDTAYIAADTLELISVKIWPKPQIVYHADSIQTDSLSDESSIDSLPEESPIDTVPLHPSPIANDSIQEATYPISPSDNIPSIHVKVDTIYPTDSITNRILKAYHNVRVWRKDMQAVGDSLDYRSADSMMVLLGNPIAWYEDEQITGDTIRVFFRNDSIDYSTANNNAFGVQQSKDDSTIFNQVSSRFMHAQFIEGKIRIIRAEDDVESIVWAQKEKSKRYYALNRMQSPKMFVYIEDDTLRRTVWPGAVTGKYIPKKKLDPSMQSLSGFAWHESARPKGPNDLFRSSLDTVYQRPSLQDLSRYDGANAALWAYENLRREELRYEPSNTADSLGIDSIIESFSPRDSLISSSHDTIPALSPYILRPDSSQALPYEQTPLIFDSFTKKWLYSHSSNKEESDTSSTNLFIQIPLRRSSNDE